MPAPIGPRQISTSTSPGLRSPALLLIAAIAAALGREHPRRAGLAIDAVGVDHGRVDRRALDDRALRGEVAAREA